MYFARSAQNDTLGEAVSFRDISYPKMLNVFRLGFVWYLH